jgi:hypothetical protein
MADDNPWDESLNQFMDELDKASSKKLNISIKDMLSDPDKYSKDAKFDANLAAMKQLVISYFGEMIDAIPEEKQRVSNELGRVDKEYQAIDSTVKDKASFVNVPYIEPTGLDFDVDKQEVITISGADNSIDGLISKLLGISNYVANVSTQYKNYMLGAWYFSGTTRGYQLVIDPPVSRVIIFENAKDSIVNLLDSLKAGA